MTSLRQRLANADQSGFTLIELLIVIVILGVLAGIAIFAAGSFHSDATAACTAANTHSDNTLSVARSINASGTYTYQDGSTKAAACK